MPVPLRPEELARWEAVLEAASRTQSAVDEAVLVGGTAVNVLVPYRTSQDADHLVHNLASIWDSVLERLDGMDGWNFHSLRERHTIFGNVDGVQVSLMDDDIIGPHGEPLEWHNATVMGLPMRLPTLDDLIRIKSYLLLFRNMARDYADLTVMTRGTPAKRLYTILIPLEHRYHVRPHASFSHDGQNRPLSFLEEMGLRLLSPKPRDWKKSLNHWDQRFRLFRPEELPSWESLIPHCQELGGKVLAVHQVMTDPEADPKLSARYGILLPRNSEPGERHNEGKHCPPPTL